MSFTADSNQLSEVTMASIQSHGNGKWRAFIDKHGVKKSKVFGIKAKARAWATAIEAEIEAGRNGEIPDKTFGDLMARYRDEISVLKKGERAERLKINKLLREDPIAKIRLIDLDERAVAAWRDRRVAKVQGSSVNREWCILSNACTIAVKEWKWLKKNPMKDVRHPPGNEHRERTATDEEIDRILFVLGDDLDQVSGRVAMVVRFALETAMRAGEIAGLTPDRVHLDKQFCKTSGKTPAARREVPLSPEAARVLEAMLPRGGATVFDVVESQIDSLFRKAKGKALVEGLHFHDLRHTAITRLATKIDVLPLAKMIGHRDLKMLMVYYNPSATDIAKRL